MSEPSSAIESVLVENRVFPPNEATVKAARISGMEGYQALCAEAAADYEGFWALFGRSEALSGALSLAGTGLESAPARAAALRRSRFLRS